MIDHGGGLVTLNSGDTLHLKWLLRLKPIAQGTKCMAILLEQDGGGESVGLHLTSEEGDQLRAAWLAWAKREAPPVTPLPLPVTPPPATPLEQWLATPAVTGAAALWRAFARELVRQGWKVELVELQPRSWQLLPDLPPLRWGRLQKLAGWDRWDGWWAGVGASTKGFEAAACSAVRNQPEIKASSVGELVQRTLDAMLIDERAATAQEVQDG